MFTKLVLIYKNLYICVYNNVIHKCSKKAEMTQISASDEWISKMWYTHTVDLFNNKKK